MNPITEMSAGTKLYVRTFEANTIKELEEMINKARDDIGHSKCQEPIIKEVMIGFRSITEKFDDGNKSKDETFYVYQWIGYLYYEEENSDNVRKRYF